MYKSTTISNKKEKSKISKRRSPSVFRSINNYQTIDKIPNDNLYKNDNFYSINKYFEFPEKEEKSFRLFYLYHFTKNGIKIMLILLYLRLCCAQINCFKDFFILDKLFNKKNIFHLISLFISLYFTNEKYIKEDRINSFLFYIFVVNQCFHIYKIYDIIDTKYEEYLSLTSELIFNFALFMPLRASLTDIIFPQIILQLVYFYAIYRHQPLYFLYYFLPGSIFVFLIFSILKKSIREIWALYDSFKRSYYNMSEGLIESDPNPIFIISRDKNIIYKNISASNLISNIIEKKNQIKRSSKGNKNDIFNNINLLDIIHPNLRELFKKILNDVMEDNNFNSFYFPICKSSLQQDLNLEPSDIYDIDNEKIYLNLIWFNFLVYKTEWKGKTSFYICCLPCEDVFLNEIIYKYTKRFSDKIKQIVNNCDIICDALINKNDKIEKKKNNINESRSSDINSDNNDNNDNKYNDSEEEEEESEEDKEIENNEKYNLKKNIHNLLIADSTNTELNNTILFFFKNQVELVYDYSLTIELYFNMLYKQRNFKFCSENIKPNLKKRIKLKELKAYYSEYFYDFVKEHKYKLEFKEEGENIYNIFIEENYLRAIFFNIIIFMICYLDSKGESEDDNKKEIIIKLIPEVKDETPITPGSKINNGDNEKLTPKISSESDHNLKKGEIAFIFESYSSNVDLSKVQELISQKNKNIYHIKSELLRLNYLDIGILAVNFLIENYYKTKMEISNKEGEQVIKFKLPCELESINSSSHSQTYQNNINSDTNSFFASPIYISKKNINKPKNFYNYNQNYNQKVLNMFYGIKKSPLMSYSRHKRGLPSFSNINEIKTNRAFERHLSQKNVVIDSKIQNNDFNNEFDNTNINDIINKNPFHSSEKENKDSVKKINNYSFKKIDFSFDSPDASPKLEGSDFIQKDKDKNKEIIQEEHNKVLIFESQRNKELISLLNNENKGEFSLEVKKDVNEAEEEFLLLDKCRYNVILINMSNNKEIKYAEMVCEKKGKTLIYGYYFGAHTKNKEKNNIKFDKRFDLSFSSEGIVFTLKHVFINNNSIIN